MDFKTGIIFRISSRSKFPVLLALKKKPTPSLQKKEHTKEGQPLIIAYLYPKERTIFDAIRNHRWGNERNHHPFLPFSLSRANPKIQSLEFD